MTDTEHTKSGSNKEESSTRRAFLTSDQYIIASIKSFFLGVWLYLKRLLKRWTTFGNIDKPVRIVQYLLVT